MTSYLGAQGESVKETIIRKSRFITRIIGVESEEDAVAAIAAGDTVSCDLAKGEIVDETTGKTFRAEPFPAFIQNIIDKGGLIKSIAARQN